MTKKLIGLTATLLTLLISFDSACCMIRKEEEPSSGSPKDCVIHINPYSSDFDIHIDPQNLDEEEKHIPKDIVYVILSYLDISSKDFFNTMKVCRPWRQYCKDFFFKQGVAKTYNRKPLTVTITTCPSNHIEHNEKIMKLVEKLALPIRLQATHIKKREVLANFVSSRFISHYAYSPKKTQPTAIIINDEEARDRILCLIKETNKSDNAHHTNIARRKLIEDQASLEAINEIIRHTKEEEKRTITRNKNFFGLWLCLYLVDAALVVCCKNCFEVENEDIELICKGLLAFVAPAFIYLFLNCFFEDF